MSNINIQDLLDAGAHFGHLTKKWNPKMAPFIFMEQNGIHLIDVNKTKAKLEEAASAMKNIIKSGRKVLFVATKKQAKEIVAAEAQRINMPYVTERWLGGMMTNFATVRKSIKKMQSIDKLSKDGTYDTMSKKERLMLDREKLKLQKVLGGIEDMNRLPAALFVVDVKREHIAIAEAMRLNIPVFGIVDTNSDPTNIDFPIPANDDAAKSIMLITRVITDAIAEGLQERKREKDEVEAERGKEESVQATGSEEEVSAE
ncbi:30S ribosomal protein S2 [Oscillatoria amoena NRMC-F 0135]|nr:MAG: 30S ribosomal protein S2 [Bacteroidota bacterium]MDL5047851.1 30S ribosomal protein S2 [Oscillatoria amoena NRMC-F 0135]